jgi:hypothetical protein
MARGPREWFLHAAVFVAAGAALTPSMAFAQDTELGTVGGLTYIRDQTPFILPPAASDLEIAQCPDGTQLVGGATEISGQGTDAHLNGLFPTTTDGDAGGFGGFFWAASGDAKVMFADATCATSGPKAAFRPRTGETESAPDAVSVKAKCKRGESVSGGGAFVSPPISEAFVNSSYPIDGRDKGRKPDDGWAARVQNRAGLGKSVTTYAICSRRSFVYQRSENTVPADADVGFIPICRGRRHLVSGGAKIGGSAGDTVLRGIGPFDSLLNGDGSPDNDAAPDDGFDLAVGNDGDERSIKIFRICKR